MLPIDPNQGKTANAQGNPTQGAVLGWDVFVTPGLPIVTTDLPPGVSQAYFQAMASTLIYGARDAVLVDAFMTVKQANALADWVAARGKNLTTIYITHGHGDHWFGIDTLLERFPNARAVATPDVLKMMHLNASPEFLKFWNAGFPGQIPDKLVFAQELKGSVIDLEGHELVAVELGHTDTDYTTCLNVLPSDSWLPAMPPTTMSTSTSPSRMRRSDGNGSLRSTKSSRSTHVQLSQHIRDPKTTTIPGSSNRPDNTSAISTG